MSDQARLQNFLDFSAEATAFTLFDLQGTGMAEDYMKTVDDIAGPAVLNALLEAYRKISASASGASPADRKAQMSREIMGDPKIGPVARNIIKLWYSGTWNKLPHSWSERFGPAPRDRTFVVSPSAYIEGLLWKAIGAHPAGAKAPGYGSWAAAPRIPDFEGDPAVPARTNHASV
jgi:hypothetical protein